MKPSDPLIELTSISSLGFPFADPFIELMTHRRPGTYVLYHGKVPVYVGRSDTSLRRRLATHPLRARCTHFSAVNTATRRQAFTLECLWYHQISSGTPNLNQIHPAKPSLPPATCPICALENAQESTQGILDTPSN
jgi:hypothetical protein